MVRLLMLATLAIGLNIHSANAAELWMFEEDGCIWCQRWHAEIGQIYPKTEEGRTAPLKQIDMHGKPLDDVELASSVRYSPTFILMEGSREIGRIEGYPGEDFFWGLLGQLIADLPKK